MPHVAVRQPRKWVQNVIVHCKVNAIVMPIVLVMPQFAGIM